MEIAEFLLARITEDEDVLNRPESFQHSSHGYDAPGTYSPTCRTWRQMVWGTRERALAECEAKRRIVEALGDFGDGYIWASGEASRAETALEALALPYADHPDYPLVAQG